MIHPIPITDKAYLTSALLKTSVEVDIFLLICNTLLVVATTCWNGTHSLLTSAKLLTGYLVVGITRELDKEPSLYCPLYIYMAPGPCYNNIYPALKSMPLPHVHYSSTMHLP